MYRVLNLFFKIGKTYTDKVESISHLLPSDKEGLYWNVREDSTRPFLVFKDVEDVREMFLSNPCVREIKVTKVDVPDYLKNTSNFQSKTPEQQEEWMRDLLDIIQDREGKFDLNFRVCSGYYKDLTTFKTRSKRRLLIVFKWLYSSIG